MSKYDFGYLQASMSKFSEPCTGILGKMSVYVRYFPPFLIPLYPNHKSISTPPQAPKKRESSANSTKLIVR